MVEIIPLWLVNLLSFVTVVLVMTSIGTTVAFTDLLQQLRAPSLLLRGLASVLVLVPAAGFVCAFALGLTLPEKVGVVLMAMAPGAPLALRRVLSSGGDNAYGPALQACVVLCAVPALPIWVAIGNAILGTHGVVEVASVARQVFLAQLLPLALGATARHFAPRRIAVIGRVIGRAGAILLVAALVAQVVDLQQILLAARLKPMLAAAIITLFALLTGRLFGGPLPTVQHAIAISASLRNVGLALLVATSNRTPPIVEEVIITYWLAAFLVVTVYILWRGRRREA